MAIVASAAPAHAVFHQIKVSEVFPGTPLAPDRAFVELQTYKPGQNRVGGHEVVVYDAAGTVNATVTMGSDVVNKESQRTILLGDIDVVNRDFYFNVGTLIEPSGGAVCFPDAQPPDCVAWGNFTANAALPAPGAGQPVLPGGIPYGPGGLASSITRSIAPGCPTYLEAGDDTDNSAADFVETPTETPRSNSEPVTEQRCERPNTKITESKLRGDTARFKFKSDDDAATHECKLDKKAYRACTSPKQYGNLDDGRHKFRVRGVNAGGPDPSPAKETFTIPG